MRAMMGGLLTAVLLAGTAAQPGIALPDKPVDDAVSTTEPAQPADHSSTEPDAATTGVELNPIRPDLHRSRPSGEPVSRTGGSAASAAVSCWDIKQQFPDSQDGAYWLLTPAMTEPQQFWCDMTTGGGGWVRVAAGRDRWETLYEGKGASSELLTAQPALTRSAQLPSGTVDSLLNNQRPDRLTDGVRLRRAANTSGSSWQEVRFSLANRDRWVWSFGAEHPLSSWQVGSSSGTSGKTVQFGHATRSRDQVRTEIQSRHGYRWGFGYGSGVSGTESASTYLWSKGGGGYALPYTFVYLRPRLTAANVTFPAIPDSGTKAITGPVAPQSQALVNPWGVTGRAGDASVEGNVEVQAIEQIGNTMFVGGNFRYVQRDQAGSGRTEQSFLAAFNASTGEHLPGFQPALNEQVRSLQALPGGLLAVGGDFTKANGKTSPGLVVLDPATGAMAQGWGIKVENALSAGMVRVRTLDARDGYLYLGGSFTHLSKPDGTDRSYARNAGRIKLDGVVPQRWNPEFNGTVLDLATSDDGKKAYYAGFFTKARQDESVYRAAAILTAGAGPDPVPWTPQWSSTGSDYQRAVEDNGERVWLGGAEHSLFDFAASNYARVGGSITKRGGDFQVIDSRGDRLLAGCHCNNWVYQDAYTWPGLGNAWDEGDAIGWFGEWDARSGRYKPEFTPTLSSRLGSGIWGIKIAENGTVWAGGDITTGLTTNGGRWLGGFARFAPRDNTAPGAPGNLRVTSDGTASVLLSWDVATGSPARYQVIRNDRVIAITTSRSLSVPVSGPGDRFFVRAADRAGNVSASTPVALVGSAHR